MDFKLSLAYIFLLFILFCIVNSDVMHYTLLAGFLDPTSNQLTTTGTIIQGLLLVFMYFGIAWMIDISTDEPETVTAEPAAAPKKQIPSYLNNNENREYLKQMMYNMPKPVKIEHRYL